MSMDSLEAHYGVSKAEHVARLLLNRIISADMKPGSSFGTEAELLEKFQVSRPTLRESLRILESQGVLTLRPGPRGGIMVAKPSINVIAHTLSVFLRLNGVPFVEILRARMAIEPVLARDAALYGNDSDFDEMEDSIKRLEAGGDDNEVVYRENRAFHSVIARAASNPVLEAFWETISILASGEGAGIKYTKRNVEHVVKSHRAILDACRQRDPALAFQLTVDHLGELDDLLKKRFKGRLDEPTQITHKNGRRIM